MTGGGSGGHITPILAVAKELKRLQPDTRIVYVSHTGDSLYDVASADDNIDEIYTVRAGKLRRYHGEGWRQIFDLETTWLNIRDVAMNIMGLWQSFWLLRKIRPSIIFTRGSYVSVPVTLAGALLGIPYVTHDSDAIPSLTNRLIARWATLHAVALPEELYPYSIDKTVTVGVPIGSEYVQVTPKIQDEYRRKLRLDNYDQVVLVTGGGLGAQRLNDAVIENADFLLKKHPGLAIIHIAGRIHEENVRSAYASHVDNTLLGRVMVKGFTSDMYLYTGASDVVIARGGATNLAELAVQAKACIIVPNPFLTGGHQVKNTQALQEEKAVIVMSEQQIQQELRLGYCVSELLDNPEKLADLQRRFASLARPDAAKRLAVLLLDKAKGETPYISKKDL